MPQSYKAAMYVRVSTERQDYEMQITEMREFAARNKWDVIEYSDKMSGAKASRPGLDRMMADARARKVDCVMVWKIDRMGRSLRDLVDNVMQLDAWGVRFLAVTQSIDTDQRNPTSRLLLHILGAVAEFERELIQARTAAGRKQYAADFAAGRIGREKQSRSGKNLAAHRPRKIFRRDLAAKLRAEGMSWRRIAAELGVPVSTVRDALAA